MGKVEIQIPDFDDEEDGVAKWLQITIWVIGIVIELLKKIKEAQNSMFGGGAKKK